MIETQECLNLLYFCLTNRLFAISAPPPCLNAHRITIRARVMVTGPALSAPAVLVLQRYLWSLVRSLHRQRLTP